ncbi:MAG: DUF5050 domain-containing protein [Clostridia bacterium]|nr:DUF5050 domain-containing protein [Clostridia bacterium]
MKKTLVYMLMIFFIISSLGSTAYSLEKYSDPFRVNLYINDMKVPIIKVGDNHYMKINDLKEFGFDVNEDKEQNVIHIYQNPNLILKPFEIDDYLTEALFVTSTKYRININDCRDEQKIINHDIVIDINSFIDVKGFNFEKWMDNKDNSCDISISNSDGIANAFTSADKTIIHMTKQGDYFYSNHKRVGFIQDNMEWISFDYITKLMDFDEITEKKYEDGMWIYLEKGDYEVEIQIENEDDAFVECGRFFMRLSALPFEENGELYLPLVDSIQLFNLEILRDGDTNNGKSKDTGDGNFINGMNVVKNNEWFYYINGDDGKTLYRTNKDMSKNERIINSSVKQFYIHNNEIFYIDSGLFESDKKGLYKARLDGTNPQQIVNGKVSFLNIIGNELYYCDGSDDGNLCRINKNGRNKSTIIEGRIAYPNIKNGWIYYINLEDNSSIYRSQLDGNYNVKINNKPATCLNVDRNKVYFSDAYNSYFMNHDGSFKNKLSNQSAEDILISENHIYWIDKYGVYKQNKNSTLCDFVIKDSDVSCIGLNDDALTILQKKLLLSIQRYNIPNKKNVTLDIEDGYNIDAVRYPYIYYKEYGGGLTKYNIETKSSQTIASDIFSEVYNIIDDWIYYDAGYDGLYRVRTDGTNYMKLLDNNIYDVHVDSSGIYYLISQSGLTIEEYCKVNLDGTNKQILIDDLVADCAFFSEVYKDHIYYRRKDGLYRIKKDGTGKKKVIDQPITKFKVMDDHIYYYYHGDLYASTCDGSRQEKIIEGIGFAFAKYRDSIFYLKNEGEECWELHRYNLRSKQSKQIPNMKFSNTYVRFVKEKDNNIVISCSTDEGYFAEVMSYYLLDMKTGEVSTLQDKIKNCYIYNVILDEDYIYYIKEKMESKFVIE